MVPYVTIGKNITPFGNVDAAWLGMEDPTNLMMIGAVFIFDRPIGYENYKSILEHRLLTLKRFRQRAVQARVPPHNKFWETDTNFDISAHVIRTGLPEPGDETALKELFNNLMSTPLDYTKPLWQSHYIDYQGGSAILWRIHHCVADGMALIHLLLSLTDKDETPSPLPETPPQYTSEAWNPFGPFIDMSRDIMKAQLMMTGLMMKEGLKMMQQPMRVFELSQQGMETMMTTNRVFTRSADPETVYKGPLSVPKRVAWSPAVPLSTVKAIQHVTGATINDILLTAMTGALRRYMVERGQETAGVEFRAAVPVNLRGKQEMEEMGNKFGLVFLSLPVGIEDQVERLKALKKRMDELKDSSEALVVLGILNTLGMSATEIQELVVNFVAQKVTAVMTNVPGPREKIYMGGAKLENVMFWVPQAGRVGLGISIFSYANEVRLGVMTDAGLVPDPEKITEYFNLEFAEMMVLAQQVQTDTPPAAEETAPPPIISEGAPEEAVPAEAVADEITQCQGLTKAGNPCKNKPLSGRSYCRVHQP